MRRFLEEIQECHGVRQHLIFIANKTAPMWRDSSINLRRQLRIKAQLAVIYRQNLCAIGEVRSHQRKLENRTSEEDKKLANGVDKPTCNAEISLHQNPNTFTSGHHLPFSAAWELYRVFSNASSTPLCSKICWVLDAIVCQYILKLQPATVSRCRRISRCWTL